MNFEVSQATMRSAAAVLKARATILAAPLAAERSRDTLDVLLLRLDRQEYAIPSSAVVEVMVIKEITPLPGAPEFVLGIINVRGQIFSVIDLLRFLGLSAEVHRGGNVVIVRSGAMELGILVDEVKGVGAVSLTDIQPASGAFASEQSAFFQGVTSARLAILNMVALLEDEKLVVNDEVDA